MAKKKTRKTTVCRAETHDLIPPARIEQSIFLIRGKKVMLDSDLAALYGVEARILKRAVRRNIERFPDDFMFELSQEEHDSLRSQFGISKGRGGIRYAPYAFTENGVAMLSTVLRSPQAIQINIEIMRAFTRIRNILAHNERLASKMDAIERKLGDHDEAIAVLFREIQELMEPPPEKPKGKIGFKRH